MCPRRATGGRADEFGRVFRYSIIIQVDSSTGSCEGRKGLNFIFCHRNELLRFAGEFPINSSSPPNNNINNNQLQGSWGRVEVKFNGPKKRSVKVPPGKIPWNAHLIDPISKSRQLTSSTNFSFGHPRQSQSVGGGRQTPEPTTNNNKDRDNKNAEEEEEEEKEGKSLQCRYYLPLPRHFSSSSFSSTL